MKKTIISLCAVLTIVALCILVSCSKVSVSEENSEPSGNLKVTVFEIAKTPFGSLTRGEEPASAACTRLNFAVYDENGTLVKQANQTNDMSDFGTASFQLEEGEYTLVVVGHSSSGNPTMTNLKKIQFTNAQGFSDTFLCCREVTIGEEPQELKVSMDRIVALCRFVVTDDFPSDVTKMRFYYTGGSGAFDATTGLGCVASKQDVKFDVTTGQQQFDLYTFLHNTEGTIRLTVTAHDAHDNVLCERQFDVPMQQNYITWVTGPLFNGSGSSSTSISGVTVNTDWAGETHITF